MVFHSVAGYSSVLPETDASWAAEIPASMKRRSPRIWQMASVSAGRALSAGNLSPRSVVVGTALGALDETRRFLDGVFTDGFGSPTNFIASVHNSMAGRIAQEFGIKGPNLTVCDGANSLASALALCGVFSDADFPVLVIAVDENIELLDRIVPHLSPACKEALGVSGRDGGIALIIDKTDLPGVPRIRSTGVRFIADKAPGEAMRSLFPPESGDRAGLMFSKPEGGLLAVPILIHDFLKEKKTGRVAYGSFSPSSRSIAAVEICG